MRRLAGAAALVLALCACAEAERPDDAFTTSEVAAAAQAAGFEPCPRAAGTPLDGLPDVELSCLGSGEPVSLARLDQRPLVINLWASWCGPCREELPFLARAHEEFDELTIIGVAYDDTDPLAAIELAEVSGVTYPQVVDSATRIREPLGVVGLPQTVFVGADGTVDVVRQPYRSYDELALDLERYLGVTS